MLASPVPLESLAFSLVVPPRVDRLAYHSLGEVAGERVLKPSFRWGGERAKHFDYMPEDFCLS